MTDKNRDADLRVRKITFAQEPHCCCPIDDEPALTIEIEDGGGGEFIILHAVHWAFEGRRDIDALHAKLIEMLDACRDESWAKSL